MKTTENISLAGYAFTIETDAFEELEAYLNDIRTCFSKDPSADEIVADIEERIAELMRERCISGMVVNLTVVREIKKRIGNPKQLAQEDAESGFGTHETKAEEAGNEKKAEKKAEKKNWKSKRLYRNMEERIFGGVCSGLGTYFGIDKVIFRLFFLLFFILGFLGIDDGPFFGFSLLGYICLWIAMPAARTDEQKREMKGKPINLKNYKEKDFDFEKEVKDIAQSPAGQTAKRAGGVFLGILLLIIGLGGMLGGLFIPSVPAILSHEISAEITQWGPLEPEEQILADLLTDSSTLWILIMAVIGLMFIWFIYNGVMMIFELKYPKWKPGLVIFIAWIISIFVLAAWVIKTIAETIPALLI